MGEKSSWRRPSVRHHDPPRIRRGDHIAAVGWRIGGMPPGPSQICECMLIAVRTGSVRTLSVSQRRKECPLAFPARRQRRGSNVWSIRPDISVVGIRCLTLFQAGSSKYSFESRNSSCADNQTHGSSAAGSDSGVGTIFSPACYGDNV